MTHDGPASSSPASAGGLVRGCLVSASNTWLALVEPARRDEPDAVHRLRVASRRLRALLRGWREVVAGDHASTVCGLRWFARSLGEVHDSVVAEQYAWQLASRTDDALVRAVLDAMARHEAARRPAALERGRETLLAAGRLLA